MLTLISQSEALKNLAYTCIVLIGISKVKKICQDYVYADFLSLDTWMYENVHIQTLMREIERGHKIKHVYTLKRVA